MMWALKSPCKALEHTRVVQSCPECELCKDYYYFLNTRGAHRVDFGTSKARPIQSALLVSSVFNNEYLGFNDLAKKSAKRWLEAAIDLVRMQRGGLKWLSTSWEWSKVVQHAKCARITTIIWTQERPPRSRISRKCINMKHSRCKIGPHGLRF